MLKYTKEKDTNDERKREKLLNTIISDVLFPSMTCAGLSTEAKESNLRTMTILQSMKTSDEIYDFYTGALQSTKGHKSYMLAKEHDLTSFEDIRDKVNGIMGG